MWKVGGGFVLVLVVVVVAACGGGVSDPRSGDRLKLAWYDAGGLRTFAGFFFDATRDEYCYPRRWRDGNLYCTPLSHPSVGYVDAQCQELAGLVGLSSDCTRDVPEYFEQGEYAGCVFEFAMTHMFRRGAKLETTSLYRRGADGSCQGPTFAPDVEFYRLGAEVSPSALAPMSHAVTDGSNRLLPRWLTSGTTQVIDGLFDSELDVECALSPDGDRTTGTCVPSDTTFVGTFADAACDRSAVEAFPGCPVPRFAVQPETSDCRRTAQYFRVDARITPSSVFHEETTPEGTSCVEGQPTPGYDYYAMGDDVEPARPPRVLDTASGTVVQQFHYSDGATSYPDRFELYDSAHRTECQLSATGGITRCIPKSYELRTWYVEPDCSTPRKLIAVRDRACGEPELGFATERIRIVGQGVCQATLNIYSLGVEYTGPVFANSPFGCVPAEGLVFREPGELHPLDEFPPVTLVRDP